jgi:hypothetical protein
MSLILSGTDGLSDVDGSAATPAIRGTDANTGIFFPAADTIAFSEGGTEAMRLDSSGNMGLGVTPSAWGSGNRAIEMVGGGISATTATAYAVETFSNCYFDGTNWRYKSTGHANRFVNYGTGTAFEGSFKWNVAASGTAGNTISFTTAMTLNASGNLGVAETSPSSQIHINGNSDNYFTAGLRVNRYTTAGQYGTVNYANGLFNITAVDTALSSPTIAFRTSTDGSATSERARIDSSGNFTLATGSQYFGMNQYTYKKQMMFNYPTSGFQSSTDCTDFYTAGASAADVNVQARLSQNGNFGLRGTLTNSATLNDYAEYFEWADGNPNAEDRVGKSVVLDGNKIRLATEQDSAADIVGVVSATAGVALGGGALEWGGKYLRDELGRQITQEVTYVIWNDGEAKKYVQGEIPDDVVVPEDAVVRTYQEQVLNPEFDENAIYQSRDNRPEWSAIGLMGQLRILKGQPVGDRWKKMRDISETVEEWFVK